MSKQPPLELDKEAFLGDRDHDKFARAVGPVEKMPEFGGVEGYDDLERVLTLAYDQSARGKGAERHAKKRPLQDQPISTIPEMLGAREGLGGLTYQVIKKTQESVGMANRGNTAAAKAELLGAIVYAAAAYLHIERFEDDIDAI